MARITKLDDIVSLCKRRGFIFQSSEIYGGLASCYDYGPLGVELKNNVKKAWWKTVVQMRDDVVGLDCSILMHPMVWKASGHTDEFADLIAECRKCNVRTPCFRYCNRVTPFRCVCAAPFRDGPRQIFHA